MTAHASLLSQIPMPQAQWKTITQTPVVASVKVGDVGDTAKYEKTDFQFGFIEKIKQKLIEKRLAKLENIPPERRTPVQQAEIEANKKSLDYMI